MKLLFDELDDNKDGLVTFEEFLMGLRIFREESAEEELEVDTSGENFCNCNPRSKPG